MHKSVLLEESIESLNIKEDGVYVDATLGYGGHSGEILKRLKKGKLFAFDQDEYAINYCMDKFKDNGNIVIIKSNFSNMMEELNKRGITSVDGILFDLGVSSVQLDFEERGFSFHKDAHLDMRMDQSKDFSAYNVVNEYSYEELVRIFREYGEEKYSTSIANKIVKYRETKNIETTLELVDIIKSGMPMKAMRDGHPARRIFQAIRIEVNNELGVLESVLDDAVKLLSVGGRLSVITFHSLEDKIVKKKFKKYSEVDARVKNLPYIPDEYMPILKITSKKIEPTKEEIDENKRSRSSRLRVAEKIKG